MSVEQMVRELLECAIAEGMVAEDRRWNCPSPLDRSAGELVAVANLLASYLRLSATREKT